MAVPEARIYALPETERSGIDPAAAEYLAELANDCQATLIGPGLVDNEAIQNLLIGLLPRLSTTSLVLDSEAMMAITGCPDELYELRCPAALTPHAGEMAGLLGDPKEGVLSDLVGSARRASARFRGHCAQKRRIRDHRSRGANLAQSRPFECRFGDLRLRGHAIGDHHRSPHEARTCRRRQRGEFFSIAAPASDSPQKLAHLGPRTRALG